MWRVSGVLVLALAFSLAVPGRTAFQQARADAGPRLPASSSAPVVWTPDVRGAARWAARRPGRVSFALRVGRRAYGHRAADRMVNASLGKTILLAAYLRQVGVRGRALTAADRALLGPMIRRSDNDAADAVNAIVGLPGRLAVARAAGLRDFQPVDAWGITQTTARDQARLFWRLGRLLPRRHRAYAMGLLRSIAPEHRWGLARVVPDGWTLHFKGGWGIDPGLVNHQAGLLVRGRRRIAIAILTRGNRTHEAGVTTLEGVARRLLRRL